MMISAGAWLGGKFAVAAGAARCLVDSCSHLPQQWLVSLKRRSEDALRDDSGRRVRQRTEPPPPAQQHAAAAPSAEVQAAGDSLHSTYTVESNLQAEDVAQAQQERRPPRSIKQARHVSSRTPAPAAAVAVSALNTEPSQKPSYKQHSDKRPGPQDPISCPSCESWDTYCCVNHDGTAEQLYFICKRCGLQLTGAGPDPDDGAWRAVLEEADAAAHHKGAARVAPRLQAPLTSPPALPAPQPARLPSNAPSMCPPCIFPSRHLVNPPMPGAVPPGYFGGAGGNFPPTFGSANGIATLPPVAPQHQDHRSMLDVSCSSYQLVPRQHMLPPPPGGCDPPMMQLSRAPTAATAVAASRPVAEPQQQQQPSQPSGLQCHLTEDGSMAGSSGRRVRQRICTAATQAQAATQKPADESRLKLLLLRLVPELKKVEEQQRLKVEQMLEAQRRMKEERGLEAEQRVKELAAVRALLDSESLQPDGAVTAPTAAERELFDMLIPSSSCIKKEPPLVEHTAGKLQLLRTDLQHLAHGNWLNDELINYALRLLQDGMPNVLFMNTFFYGKLYQDKKKYSYAEVQRWTAPKRLCEAGVEAETILDVELVVVPIHLLAHFICFIIDVQARVIRCYDSLGHSHDTIAEHLARYMEDEAENKKPQEHKQGLWDRQAWRVEYPSRPGQTNGCDCGVFTIKYAQYGSAGRPFDFTQDDMPNLRIKLLADLFRQRMV